MNQEQLTNASAELFQKAVAHAQEQHHAVLQLLHLIAVATHDQLFQSCFKSLKVDIKSLDALIMNDLSRLPKVIGTQVGIDQNFSTLSTTQSSNCV